MAIWLVTSHKKGIANTQLARDIGVTQKTAWFMLHWLRYAAETKSLNAPLKGQVEADETCIGGKEKNKHAGKKKPLEVHPVWTGHRRWPEGLGIILGIYLCPTRSRKSQ